MTKRLRLVVSGTLLAWLAWRTDWAQVGSAFAHLHPGPWLLAVALYVLCQFVSSLRWRLLAQPLGFAQPLRQFTGYYFIGMYFNLLLPTSVGGDVVRAWYLDGGSGRRLAAFFSVFIDRFSGLLLLLALACGAALLCPIALPDWVSWSVWGTAGAAGVGFASLPLLSLWTRRLERLRRLQEQALLYLTLPGLLLSTTGLSLFVQAANVIIVWLIGQSIDAPVPGAYYWVIVPLVTLLTMLPVSLNGMGIREWAMAMFLAPLGVLSGTALSLSFLWFAVFLTASLFGGAVYIFGYFPRPQGSALVPGEVRSDHEPLGGGPAQGRTGQHPSVARPAA